MEERTGRSFHASLWWMHTIFAMGWIALIPYTKFVHLLSLPTNVFFSKLKPRGELQRAGYRKADGKRGKRRDLKIGLQKADELTWKQRMDLDTCVSCGRCEEVCPAYMADKEYFTPRQLIARIKQSLTELESGRNGGKSDAAEPATSSARLSTKSLSGIAGPAAHAWKSAPRSSITSDTLMELRRNEVLIQGRVPEEAGRALRLFETNGNPFGPQSERTDWIEQSKIRVVGPGEKVDVLYWIGCIVAFDPQKHKIAERHLPADGKVRH